MNLEKRKEKKWRTRWSENNDGEDETELWLCLTAYGLVAV